MVELGCRPSGPDGPLPLEDCLAQGHDQCVTLHAAAQCNIVEAFLLERDLQPIREYSTDMTQDSIPEIVVHALPYGCGSCHGQQITIFQGSVLLFDEFLDEPQIRFAPPYPLTGFWLKEPLRRDSAPFCCSSQYLETFYEWDGQQFSRPLDY
ncbi:MAG: hypothetical protein IIA90_08965 [Chloroflexi bacterium]|nr:hypothetical protein [Chloroflexota bacterium]